MSESEKPTHTDAINDNPPQPKQPAVDPIECDLKFFWGVASGSSRKAIEMAHKTETIEDHGHTVDLSEYPAPPHAMLSYETRNNIPKPGPDWFIDCGAYSSLHNSDRFVHEKPIEDYIDYLIGHIDDGISIEKWALRDWPHDKEILDETGRDIKNHQHWSIRDHIRCLEVADEKGLTSKEGAEPVPVIQGRDANDYLWHLDYMRDHGLLSRSSTVSIGSLVYRDKSEVQSIIERVKNALPSKYELHGLGLKKSQLNNVEAVEVLDSVDSTCWAFSTMKMSGGDDQTSNWVDNLEAYMSYRNQLEAMFDGQGETSNTLVSGLSDFLSNPEQAIGQTQYPLLECVCGTLVDINAIADERSSHFTTGSKCRHCQRLILNLKMEVMGLGCSPGCMRDYLDGLDDETDEEEEDA